MPTFRSPSGNRRGRPGWRRPEAFRRLFGPAYPLGTKENGSRPTGAYVPTGKMCSHHRHRSLKLVGDNSLLASLRVPECLVGVRMSDHLTVDGAGLRAAASDVAAIADSLGATGGSLDTTPGAQPSHQGVRTIDVAVAAIQSRASTRAHLVGEDLSTAGTSYMNTDQESAGSLQQSL